MNKKLLFIVVSLYCIGFAFLLIYVFFFILSYFSIPKIELVGDRIIELNIGETYIEKGAKACENNEDISSKIKIIGNVDTSKVGKYEVIYTVSNRNNKAQRSVKRIIIVVDNVPPVIKLNGEEKITVYIGSEFKDLGATAVDNVDGDITSEIVTTGNVDFSTTGQYKLVYSVSDRKGNVAATERIVEVKESKHLYKGQTTYVLVSIDEQKLWFYYDDELITTSNIVTGRKGVNDTPRGVFHIYSKATNTYLVGPDYKSYVNYWMAITGDIGLHDALWQSNFGGSVYTYSGSHGCINLPYETARIIYNMAPVGTLVEVY